MEIQDVTEQAPLLSHDNQHPPENRNSLIEPELCDEVKHILEVGRRNRSLKLIVPEVTASVWTGDLHNQHWEFVVPYGMRDAIDIRMQDITTTQYLKVGHSVKLPSRLSLNLDKLKQRKRLTLTNRNEAVVSNCTLPEDKLKMLVWQMRLVKTKRLWTQGGILSFDLGDSIPSSDRNKVVSILGADRMGFDVAKNEMDYGFVRFQVLKKTGYGEQLEVTETLTMNQPKFLNFLIRGTK